MIGRFLFGAFSGVALVVSGMVAGSALFPLRGPSEMPPEETATPTVAEGTEAAMPEAEPIVVAEAEVPAVEPEPVEVAPESASATETAAQPEVTEAPAALPEPTVEAEATETSVVAEVAVPATPEAPAALPAPTEDPAIASTDSGATATAPEAASEPTPEPAPADASAQPAEASQPAAEPEPEPAIEPTPEAAPEPEATSEDAVVAEVTEDGDAESSTFAPSKGFASDETLTTDSETAAPAEDTSAADTAMAGPTSTLPMALYAAKFDNPEAKPVLAIVLIDTGAADLDRAALAALPFPVSFALDPMDPATPDRAALYRAAGREVIMLATGIAEGSQASDIEVAFQSMSQRMPEAVAVMDLSVPVFQDNRPLASLVVPVIGGDGRGVLSWDKGLNAADQVARREDVASAVIFRDLAMGGGDAAAAKRTLDRAVFKAGQDGRVVVAGEVTPELIAGLLEWSVEGRAGAVALGPLTAVLKVD